MFAQFISEYGTQIIFAILTAVAGYLGMVAKNLYEKLIKDKKKKDIAKTVVNAVEQMYKNLHGDEKLDKALEAASEMLVNNGITVTELELRMLIEAAVAEFNEAFKKTTTKEETSND